MLNYKDIKKFFFLLNFCCCIDLLVNYNLIQNFFFQS